MMEEKLVIIHMRKTEYTFKLLFVSLFNLRIVEPAFSYLYHSPLPIFLDLRFTRKSHHPI